MSDPVAAPDPGNADSSNVAPPQQTTTPTMSWEPIRKRLLGSDQSDALEAAKSIRHNVSKLVQHPSEFALLLSALLPALSSLLTSTTTCRPTAQGPNQQLRQVLLQVIAKFPCNEILRPHASHLILVAMDVLNRDYEENALLASQIIFDLYKTYRSLPQDHVQPFLDFVILVYQALPSSVKRNFSAVSLRPDEPVVVKASAETSEMDNEGDTVMQGASSSDSQNSGSRKSLLPSKISFRVLTECPLTVMLMFQLYPSFLQPNVNRIIKVMLDALGLKAPSLSSVLSDPDRNVKRLYSTRRRELVVAQAKTLSFVTMLLKSFTPQLAPYKDRLAQNVVDLFKSCPNESIGTRKELMAATRHLFNSELKSAFLRHVDVLLDERLFLGQHHRHYMSTLLRTMGYQTLSELVQHVRGQLTMPQATRIVGTFARVLHDRLPIASQYAAVRTLLSLGDVIYRNKDGNPQMGRDLLLRILTSLASKLEGIIGQEDDWKSKAESDDFNDAEAVRDAQTLIRLILVGSKNMVNFLADYRNQREKVSREAAMPPPGSNEEVSSAYHKLTQTEVKLLNRYLLAAIPGLAVMRLPSHHSVAPSPTSSSSSRDTKVSDQYRDALTYFAATFANLDGHNLRRTIGRHLGLLVDAIIDDPIVMIVPRHLLAVNATTSFEFCAILVPYLMGRLGELGTSVQQPGVTFVDPFDCDVDDCRGILLSRSQSETPSKRERDISHALLQLFERVLKSLASYPDNEILVRRHLRAIVSRCLSSCLENTAAWPDDYCMLLRFVFRSISAGKFEESYRELLPLIPTVLNGLYRIIVVSEDILLRHTAMELCLTIPARLSSLLPHMNLLLRVIIPALDSGSGDLVNLGLRTLEFWVDNLNPLFLYPEMSKQTPLFAYLMQSLSCHLRPAPYPYGLLTLRLLGKLGGHNRRFLREPLLLTDRSDKVEVCELMAECSWNVGDSRGANELAASLPLPVESCLEILKLLAVAESVKAVVDETEDQEENGVGPGSTNTEEEKEVLSWDQCDLLWSKSLDVIDFKAYSVNVRDETRHRQAQSALRVVRASFEILLEATDEPSGYEEESDRLTTDRQIILAFLYSCCIESLQKEALELAHKAIHSLSIPALTHSISLFVGEAIVVSKEVATKLYEFVMETEIDSFDKLEFWNASIRSLCTSCCSSSWEKQQGCHWAICHLIERLGRKWAFEHEMILFTTSMQSLTSIPRELSGACIEAVSFFVRICVGLYGEPRGTVLSSNGTHWDVFSGCHVRKTKVNDDAARQESNDGDTKDQPDGEGGKDSSDSKGNGHAENGEDSGELKPEAQKEYNPGEEVLSLTIRALVSTQQLARFASRFLLLNYTSFLSEQDFRENFLDLVKRVLFSRSLKLLPLPQQVGAVEALTLVVTRYCGLLLLSDQYVLAFLSELLKMASVADGDMTDSNLSGWVIDRNGFCGATDDRLHNIADPSHSSSIFFRRDCILEFPGFNVHVPAELPTGVQLRISSIKLLNAVVRNQSDSFFDAENTTPIGNIRPHVISLLFRSLVSQPERAVSASHMALREVLDLSVSSEKGKDSESSPGSSRLRKELLQTCIRPVLLNLRDYDRLSVPLLRGLSKLLSLLSSWFNKTLGEKLLDHLQKWMEPGRILSKKLWRPGDEPAVAAAIVDIFALLPHASNFVEPLVKTCMKLEVSLPALKVRCVHSPYRRPLARYLNKHPASTVNFFFKRLPTPMYSELFQWLVRYEESTELRSYLAGKPCSMMILNHCFEKPLGIIRSEKDTSTGHQPTRNMLAQHGIGVGHQQPDVSTGARMSIGALELQLQGFILVDTLMTSDPDYIKEQGDIVRAFRWLWRSKGRALRFKHENGVPPRFHSESKMLASFLMSYAKSYPSEGLDILFELVSAFIQPATVDFQFLVTSLHELVTTGISFELKQRVVERFFELMSRDKSEEMKVLSAQYLVYPMLQFDQMKGGEQRLLDKRIVSRFMEEVLCPKGSPVVCTDRLKVEFLRLVDLMLQQVESFLAPFQSQIVEFCLNLLKNDDLSCKGWSYILLSRMIVAFDSAETHIFQVYSCLLRTHEQDNKEMVRKALDLLLPALALRLEKDKAEEAIKEAATVLIEDANSSPQVAHICTTVLANPSVFFPYREVFCKHITNSLNRLALPSTPTMESRILAVDVVELLVQWDSQHTGHTPLLSGEQVDLMANLLVRLKLLVAESQENRGFRVELLPPRLEERVMRLIRSLIPRHGVEVRKQPFEKVAGQELPVATTLIACIDMFICFSATGQRMFFTTNLTTCASIIQSAFARAGESLQLQKKLRAFLENNKDVTPIISSSLVALERIVNNSTREQRKNPHSRSNESRSSLSRSGSKEKAKAFELSAEHTYFAIRLALDIANDREQYLCRITSSLICFADAITKNHLIDAAAKQRQGTPNGAPNASPGLLHHTPTRGIIEEACLRDRVDASRLPQGKSKGTKDSDVTEIWNNCLIATLSMFEGSQLPFTFSQDRKALLHILSTILDSSDNVQLLMISTRLIGKWLLGHTKGGPLTLKERNSFLWKIASFDFNGLADDLSAQPLADLVSHFVASLKEKDSGGAVVVDEDIVVGRSLVACLLNARCDARNQLLCSYLGSSPGTASTPDESSRQLVQAFWRLLHSDVEGLASRSWIALFVDSFLTCLTSKHEDCVEALRILAQGDAMVCQRLFECMFPFVWRQIPDDGTRLRFASAMETFLARPFHSQFQKSSGFAAPRERRCSNAIRAFLGGVALLRPCPVLDTHLMVSVAENYCCWYEVIALLEQQYHHVKSIRQSKVIVDALRHCYRELGEEDLCIILAKETCEVSKTRKALSFDMYSLANDAVATYEDLVDEVEAVDPKISPTDFEMDLWEERWVNTNRELCQLDVVSEFANSAGSLRLRLECAWKSQDWHTVRSLCTSTSLLAAVEIGDPIVKISETLLAVADGKHSEVENLHAQTAQLCLHKWQLLPRLSSGSLCHSSLLHYFHRLVEIRESGQIMVETSNHSKVKTLPDLKNLLSTWRHRLPNSWEPMTVWDDIFAWRTHMFTAITSNFSWSEPNTLATLHDRPWTAIRMAKTARKHNMRDVSLLLLNKAVDEAAMNVADAFLKLREQILAYFNKTSEVERHGGLNLINATNLSFFDQAQKSELFRLKASFLASLGSRSKANQGFCHSLQICPTHSRAWESWGELCSNLGDVAEKQVDDVKAEVAKDPSKQESVAAASKKVAQYLAQAMGCYLEAIQIDANEWNRVHLPKCIWMLTKDGGSLLCNTFENRGSTLPAWVWLPWLPQLFTCLYRDEGRAVRAIFERVLRAYPQAVYYPLRAFFLERRDVERAKNSSTGQLTGSAGYAEEMVSHLRRSHTSLWSSLEAILEEMLVTFRPSQEEEFLTTIIALLERTEAAQSGSSGSEEEDTVTTSIWKMLSRIAIKYFRPSESGSQRKDKRGMKIAEFKTAYRTTFEKDFHVSASDAADADKKAPISLKVILKRIRQWKEKLEMHVQSMPRTISLIETSRSLAMFGVGDSPDLWSGSCDPRHASPIASEHDQGIGTEQTSGQSTTSSVLAAKKAAINASKSCAAAATREGVDGDYGGGSSFIEIPGQYMPHSSCWADSRPSPELHPKLMRFEPTVKVLTRNDQLVRRIGMIGSDGKVYRFLLQCVLPYWTRNDERTTQTIYILDKVLRKSRETVRTHVSMQPSTIIPVAQRLRLAIEPDSQRSLEQVVNTHLAESEKSTASSIRSFEQGVKKKLADKSFLKLEADEKLAEGKKRRMEVFDSVSSESDIHANMLSQHLMQRLESPEPYFQFRRMFTGQWAANCLLQHVFQVTERTPSQVVFIERDGRVTSTEFRIRYTSQGLIEVQDTVPFRLTPNIVNLIGPLLLDGRFVTSMARIATVVSEAQGELDPVFRLLLRDDLTTYFTKSMAKSDSKTQEMEARVADRVSQNVASIQKRFRDASIDRSAPDDEPVDKNVRVLVEIAQDKERLAMMTGVFQGWI